MKKWKNQLIKISLLSLLLAGAGSFSASAQVTEGQKGETVYGDYAVIVNTSMTETQSTGTLVFDSSGNGTSAIRTSSASNPVGKDVQAGTVAPIAMPYATSVSYSIGEEKYISRASGDGKTYVCIGEGAHCYIWMDKSLKSGYDSADKTSVIAADMIQTYDGKPFEILNKLAGGNIPCQDGSGKLSILLETLTGASGVFKNDVGITAIHINTPAASAYQKGEMSARNGLLVHEGQHALFHLLAKCDTNEQYLWLNEGISVAVMDYLWGGTDSNGWMDGIADNADIRNGSSLFYREYRDSTARDYGMPYLFVRYLIAQATGGYKPMELFPKFYTVSADCNPGVYLQRVLGNGKEFKDLLTQFYTAIIAQESSGVYGFAGDAIVRQKVSNYPLYMGASGQAHNLAPTAAIMIKLEGGSFQVPSNGGSSIRYMIVSGGRNVAVPTGGDGTSEHPYEISDFADLALIGNKPGAHYKLTQNIDANGQMNLTITYFSGVLDGAGYTIHGLSMPLVGRNGGTIRNLTIEAAFSGEFTGTQGIFTQVNSGMIKNCMATGTVDVRMLRGQSSLLYPVFGAFAGENEVAGTIQNCGTRADINLILPAATSWIGGIAGIQTGVVKNCYSRGNIVVTQPNDGCTVYVGGLAGKLAHMNMGGILNCCIYTGSIRVTGGNSYIGQLCGHADSSVVNSGLEKYIKDCKIKAGNGSAVGYAKEELPQDLDSRASLTEEQIKKEESYKGWDFVSDWKMGAEGPEHLTSADIDTFQVVDAQTSCYIGEAPYSWGYVSLNGIIRGAKITDDMVSGFDSRTEGTKTVTVTYLGKETTYQIQVKKPTTVTELKVSKVNKTTYASGEYFDLSGVKLSATIDGNSSRILTSGFDCDKKAPLTVTDTSVTFTYYGASVEFSPIKVVEKAPSSMAILSNMGTTLYLEGQKLDLSDVQVQLTYNNGEKTPVFGVGRFDDYGLRVVKKLGDTYKVMQLGETLHLSDDNAAIYLCANNIMPNASGTISKKIGTITVKEPLHISETTLRMAQGKADQWITAFVEGGSGDNYSRNYETIVIEENLPPGVSRDRLPSASYTSFVYTGVPIGPTGFFTSVYLVKDTGTGEGLTVELTIEVHPSNVAKFFRFDLLATQNKNVLTKDVIGLIGENEIILRLPEGTDVTHLVPEIDFGYSMGVDLPSDFWNNTQHDFTNPVAYTLTAPDGVTKQTYMVRVEFFDSDSGSTEGGTTPSEGETLGGDTGGASGSESMGGNTDEESGSGAGSTPAPGESTGGNTENETTSGGSTATGGNPSAGIGSTNGGASESTAVESGDAGASGTQAPNASFGRENSAAYPAVGTLINRGGLCYRITASSPAGCTAELYRPIKKKKAAFKVAATVKAGGYTYRVTSIAARAFRNNRYLKRITIGKYVTSIENQAFYGCKNLKLITVKSKVLKSVRGTAVKGIHPKAVIRVPKNKRAAYKKLFKRKVS